MTNISDYYNALDEAARKEFERIWSMRSDISGVNEATIPILIQYCDTYSKIQRLSTDMNSSECDKEWDKNLARLDKLNKMLLSFAKVLKLCDGGSADNSNNKFAKLLLK